MLSVSIKRAQLSQSFMLFRLLVNCSARFHAVQPAFKLFGLISKRDHFALYN